MQDTSNISSEEELLQLRNEGKISNDEYQQLRGAMQKSAEVEMTASLPEKDEKKSKRRLGKIAFYLMLLGVVLPAVWFWLPVPQGHRTPAPTKDVVGPNGEEFTGPAGEEYMEVTAGESEMRRGFPTVPTLIFQMAAFAMAVVAWPDAFAKATVATISFTIVVGSLLVLLFGT